MERVKTLRQHAHLFRTLAKSFKESPTINEDLLALARRCDELAVTAAREIKERLSQPISRVPPS